MAACKFWIMAMVVVFTFSSNQKAQREHRRTRVKSLSTKNPTLGGNITSRVLSQEAVKLCLVGTIVY